MSQGFQKKLKPAGKQGAKAKKGETRSVIRKQSETKRGGRTVAPKRTSVISSHLIKKVNHLLRPPFIARIHVHMAVVGYREFWVEVDK